MHSIPYSATQATGQQGFTLIELSIVLVIIGLIIGGILVGQDLIKAAEIRATLAQIEKYNSAVNTFRNKYNQMPGDFVAQQAPSFGFAARGNDGPTGNLSGGDGDGNGILDNCAPGGAFGLGCETSLFWDDLGKAGYIDITTSLGEQPTAKATASAVVAALPNAKLGRGNTVSVYEINGINYWFIGVVSAIAAPSGGGAGGGAYTLPATPQGGMSPNQAYNMDKKVDDGLPLSGIVTIIPSITTFSPGTAPTAGFTQCTLVSGAYNVTSTSSVADSPLCQMQYRFN